MNQFICYPKCSTCIKAKKVLKENNVSFEIRHIVEKPLNEIELESIYKKSKLSLKKLFNTSGLVYKELKLKDKLDTMSEKEQIKLLASNAMLVKRPIFISDDKILVGFKKEDYIKII